MSNTNLLNEIETFLMHKVKTKDRFNFFPTITKDYLTLENAIYNLADKTVDDYSGGYWEFYEIHWNGKILRFAEVPIEGNFQLSCFGLMCDVEVDGITAGIAIMMMALCHLSYRATGLEQDRLIDAYYDFKAFLGAVDFKGANAIYKYLD